MDLDFLKSKNITKVLTIQSWEVPKQYPEQCKYEFIKANDCASQNLGKEFPRICQILKNASEGNERVLVHCQAGISRSATACLAYLMKEKQMSLDYSFNELRKRREQISPNFAFLGQLKSWERELIMAQ